MALKNDILLLLEQNRKKIFSGSMLAEQFGVSRNAVWKAVNTLKDEGHSIESVGKKGYRLTNESDLLSVDGVKGFLFPNLQNIALFVEQEVGSTNEEAKRRSIDHDRRKVVFIADRQSSGKGRMGRKFYSPAATGLYLSCVLYPEPHRQMSETVIYTAMAGVAAVRAITAVCGVHPQIKWINDLYVDERKVAGILTEAETDLETGETHRLIVGIGVNITTEVFPDELKDKAASLGVRVNRNKLAAAIVNEFYSLAEKKADGIMDEYREDCFLIGREVSFSDGRIEFSGVVKSIGDNCELVLETGGEVKIFTHGEILSF